LSQELHPGFIEEVEMRLIKRSPQPIRGNLGPINELAASISEKGLLEPIVIRPVDGRFEIVAGNRRLAACKSLGMRKVVCHILDFTEKEAYEAALIENVQHRTLDAVDEARAFKRYVDDYGYGGESELARKIGKSEQYVSQRLQLLTLPRDVLMKVTRRLVSASQASELLGLDREEQSLLSDLVAGTKVPSKTVRRLAKEIKSYQDPFEAPDIREMKDRHIQRTLSKCILLLKTTLIRLDDVIQHMDENNWMAREVIMTDRTVIHDQIDRLIKLRIRLNRAEYVKGF
jgi:ParB family transcriptional regulator, chromosome partitioning protein